MPTAAPVERPPDGSCVGVLEVDELGDGVVEEEVIEEEDVVVASELENVLKNVGSLSVTQHVWHFLLAHTQSRSQSFSLLHESPRQCPSQVHTATAVVLDCDAVRVCRVSDVIVEDIVVGQGRNYGSFRPSEWVAQERESLRLSLSACRIQDCRRLKFLVLAAEGRGLQHCPIDKELMLCRPITLQNAAEKAGMGRQKQCSPRWRQASINRCSGGGRYRNYELYCFTLRAYTVIMQHL